MLQRFFLTLTLLVLAIPFCRLDNLMDMIRAEDYPAEKHTVQTRDGYILNIYRIPNMKNVEQTNRKVVLFMHGMFSAAPVFVTYSNTSAGYIFSDAGYDVWIGSARGSTYSRRHKKMSPRNPKFWDFSWHEMGVYDLPATIDYILNATNQTKLSYVGHSQGVTVVFVLLSELPEYNDKISIVHAMTPSVIFNHIHPLIPWKPAMDTFVLSANIMNAIGINEVAAYRELSAIIEPISQFCMRPPGRALCRSAVYFVMGPSLFYFDELLVRNVNHLPGGASYKQGIHYGQVAAARRFQQYHHGTEKNIRIYGTPEPPPYNLSNVRTNVHIMHGTNDWLAPSANVPLLAKALGRYPVAISKLRGFNHVDFAYGSNLQMAHRKIFKVEQMFG